MENDLPDKLALRFQLTQDEQDRHKSKPIACTLFIL
jgi:hypothetical protein